MLFLFKFSTDSENLASLWHGLVKLNGASLSLSLSLAISFTAEAVIAPLG